MQQADVLTTQQQLHVFMFEKMALVPEAPIERDAERVLGHVCAQLWVP